MKKIKKEKTANTSAQDEEEWVSQQMHHLQRNLRNGGSHARNLTDYTKIVLHRAMLLPQCTYRLCAGVSCSHNSVAPSGGGVENGVSYCLTWKLWLTEQAWSILHVYSQWTFVSIHIHMSVHTPHMWQPRTEFEYYSTAYFECIPEFDVV